MAVSGMSSLQRYILRPPLAIQWGSIIALFLVITVAHNKIHLSTASFQMILLQKLFFIPVILAGFWSGVKGGVLSAAMAAFLYPHRGMLHMHDDSMFSAGQTSDMVLLFMVGGITGLLRDFLNRELERHRRTAEERDRALTESRRNFEMALRSERLAALGQMVAGIAHEVGNPLTSMLGSVEILRRSQDKAPEREKTVLSILEKEINRLDEITRRFLEYARPRQPAMKKLNPGEVVDESVALMLPQIEKAGFTLKVESRGDEFFINGDKDQLHQVLVNLLLNASQYAYGGTAITISSAKDNGFWRLTVHNEGPEIPEGDHEKIFNPFVTTRPSGTGLGLAVANGIAEAHGGTLVCRCDDGTDFILRIPLMEGE